MSDIKWIKIDTGLFNNRKIKVIERMNNGDALIIIWLKMLILAAEVNDGGYLYFTDNVPYDADLLATQFDRPAELITEALNTFVKYDMLEKEPIENDKIGFSDIYRIANWEKYQNIDGMERIREQNRLRKQRERDRKRDVDNDGHVTERDSHVTDKDKEKDIDKDNKKSTAFVPPTLDEVKAYCLERGNNVDPQAFIDFYTAKGWLIGKNKVKDWRACVRTWENRDKQPNKPKDHGFTENTYDFKDLEAQILNSQRQADKKYTV